MSRILLFLSLTAALVAAAPAAAAPTAWKGVVVAKDVKRGTVVTASANGVVRTTRSPKARSLKLGQRLDVRASALADGTFKALSVKASGRAKTARVKAVVVRYQKAQRRLLVSAGGSTFALSRARAARTLSSTSETSPRAGDQIAATVSLTGTTPQATSVTTTGHLGMLEVEGIVTKIAPGSIELIVAKAGFVTLAVPATLTLPASLAVFDEVKAHVAVGTDGKLSLLSIQSDDETHRDDDGVDFHDDDGELEVTGTITALTATSVTVSPGAAATAVTCSFDKPLTGFAVGDRVEIECKAGTAGALVLTEIEHEDDDHDEDDDDDDDDHDDDDHDDDDDDDHGDDD